jgi:CheY-like chemotaxis protein
MFDADRIPPDGHADPAVDPQSSVARLCVIYDPLLTDADFALSPRAEQELKGLAGIFDLDPSRPSAEVWVDLRAVLTRHSPIRREQPAPADEGSLSLTLMVVEDEPEIAADLTEILTEAGHRVIGPFHSAEAAEVSAALHPVDLALLDVNLSGPQSGIALARTLKDRWGVASLFLSGDVTATARDADRAEAILIKPYGGREVLDAVARVWRAIEARR